MPERVTGSRALDMFAVNVLRIVAAILLIFLGCLGCPAGALLQQNLLLAVFLVARLR